MRLELRPEDLSEQHRQYADVIGIDKLLALAKEFGGTSIYIPKTEELLKKKKYDLILKEFNGANVKFLAKKYSVSESTVYNVVREKLRNAKTGNIEGQTSIFDFID